MMYKVNPRTLFAPRTGRDNSTIPLRAGPVGIGIPRWLALVLAYLAVVLTLVWLSPWVGAQTANLAAGSGPAVLGFIDLWLRLRTTRYITINPLGMELTHDASVVDRLSMRECGWYLPLLAIPLPLWLIGAVTTVEILTL